MPSTKIKLFARIPIDQIEQIAGFFPKLTYSKSQQFFWNDTIRILDETTSPAETVFCFSNKNEQGYLLFESDYSPQKLISLIRHRVPEALYNELLLPLFKNTPLAEAMVWDKLYQAIVLGNNPSAIFDYLDNAQSAEAIQYLLKLLINETPSKETTLQFIARIPLKILSEKDYLRLIAFSISARSEAITLALLEKYRMENYPLALLHNPKKEKYHVWFQGLIIENKAIVSWCLNNLKLNREDLDLCRIWSAGFYEELLKLKPGLHFEVKLLKPERKLSGEVLIAFYEKQSTEFENDMRYEQC